MDELCLIANSEIEPEAVGSGQDAELDEDDDVWRVGLGGRLDVTEMVRQAILLALPTKSRCDQDALRTTDFVASSGETPESRWEALRSLHFEGEDDGRSKAKDE